MLEYLTTWVQPFVWRDLFVLVTCLVGVWRHPRSE